MKILNCLKAPHTTTFWMAHLLEPPGFRAQLFIVGQGKDVGTKFEKKWKDFTLENISEHIIVINQDAILVVQNILMMPSLAIRSFFYRVYEWFTLKHNSFKS
jgi:hypothetical protein